MEIIKRSSEVEKESVNTTSGMFSDGVRFQVGFNNFGHLSLRFFKEAESIEGTPPEVPKETLIVLSKNESDALIAFVKERLQ